MLKVVLTSNNGEMQSEKWLNLELDQPRKMVLLISERVNELHKFLRLNLPDSLYLVQVVQGTTIAQQVESKFSFDKVHPDLIILNQPGESILTESVYRLIGNHISKSLPLILFHDGSEPMSDRLLEILQIQQTQAIDLPGEGTVFWGETASSHPLYLELIGQGGSPSDLLKYPPLYRGLLELQHEGTELLITRSASGKSAVLTVRNRPPLASFSGGDTWRWFFHPQSSKSFSILWSYLLLYLEDVAHFKPVNLDIPRETAVTGAYVSFDITVKNLDNKPIPTAELRAWQEDKNGKRETLNLTRSEVGRYTSILNTKQPGEVTVFVEAYRFGELWGRDTSRIQLEAFNGENQSTGVDEIFLERLCRRSGTQIIKIGADELPKLPKEYYTQKSSIHMKGVRAYWMFVMLISLLIIEWILRRRNGLL